MLAEPWCHLITYSHRCCSALVGQPSSAQDWLARSPIPTPSVLCSYTIVHGESISTGDITPSEVIEHLTKTRAALNFAVPHRMRPSTFHGTQVDVPPRLQWPGLRTLIRFHGRPRSSHVAEHHITTPLSHSYLTQHTLTLAFSLPLTLI